MQFTQGVIVTSEKLKAVVCNYDRNLLVSVSDDKSAISFGNFRDMTKSIGFSDSNSYVHELLNGCDLLLPAPFEEPRNPELEARVQKLRNEYLNKEYNKMTRNLGVPDMKGRGLKTDLQSGNTQITAVINFALTVVGSFVFSYKALEYAMPEANIPAQVLVGILTASVVAIADLYFILRDL